MAIERVSVISKTVTSAGTAEALSASDVWVSWMIVEAKASNAGSNVYRGDSDVDNTYPTITSTKSFSWASAGENTNLKDWYIDVDTSGDGVWITYGVAQVAAPEDP